MNLIELVKLILKHSSAHVRRDVQILLEKKQISGLVRL